MAELYPGCAVDILLAGPFDEYRAIRWARYVKESGTPDRVWLVCWRGLMLKPYWALVDASRVVVSSRPQEPPPLPDWAKVA
jgi:hypothetical protein